MYDYYEYFLISSVMWIVVGLFYEFMFRRSKDPYLHSLRWNVLIIWFAVTGWMVYNLVRWRLRP